METIITTLLVMGLQASILAIIIMIFRELFRKAPKIYVHILWLVMLTRLVVPVIIEGDYGVTPSPDRLVISSSVLNVNPETDNRVNTNPSTTVNDSTISDTTTPDAITDSVPDTNTITNTPQAETSSPATETTPSLLEQAWLYPALCAVWSLGCITVLLFTLLQYFSMKRTLRFAIRITDYIWECESVKSPFVMGFIKPRIYLPINLSTDEREYILMHEKMHIKHFDHIIRLLMTLAVAIHWWNPIIWFAMNLMKKDMEMLCDESVIRSKETEYRKAYSMTLLKYAAKTSGLSPVLSFGESNTERRVKHLMLLKKPKRYVSIAMILVMSLCLISCIAQGPSTGKKDNNEKPSYIPEETVTIYLYSELSSTHGVQEGWYYDILKENFNIELYLVDSSLYNEDYFSKPCDIIVYGNMGENYTTALENGEIMDLSQYDMSTYMPYITANLENSYVRNSDSTSDSIYGVYTNTSLTTDFEPTYWTWDMRYDYYEELGTPEISDIDDWVNVLSQIKEKHPTNDTGEETYAISYPNEITEGKIWGITNFVSAYYGYESHGMGYYDWKNDKYYGLLAMNEDGSYGPYLEMLKLNNELYQKGLLDPDVDTQSWDDSIVKAENQQTFASISSVLGSLSNENMYPVKPQEAVSSCYALGHRNPCITINANTQYPELCMAIIDYFYSPEGMLTMTYGPEGECWYYDEAGNTCLTELGLDCWANGGDTILHGESYWAGAPKANFVPYNNMATNTDNGEVYNYTYWENVVTEPVNDVESAWREWSGSDSIDKYLQSLEPYYVIPDINYIEYDDTENSEQYDAVSNLIAVKSFEAIKASSDAEFETIVQEMITLAYQAGYEECVEYSENYIKEQLEAIK